MRRLLLFVPLLGGCPPASQYLITDVTAFRAPVADALVAADCGNEYGDAALRTDVAGRARLQFRHKVDASKCSVVVAKEGFPTIVATNVSICTTPACPATHVELGEGERSPVIEIHEPPAAIPLVVPREYEYVQPREYARPPHSSLPVRKPAEVAR